VTPAVRRPGFTAASALFALAVRLLYILVIAPEPVGVGGDASFYHSAANLIARGHFYERRIFGGTYQTALHPPLFSLLLSIVALLGGVHVLPQRLVGCVIGAANVGLIAILAERAGGRRAAVIASLIAAVYPPIVTADGSLQAEPLFVFLLLVALLIAQRIVAAGPTIRLTAGLGAVIGLGTLARTEALLLLAVLAVPALWRHPPGRTGRIRAIAVCVAACSVVLAPWVIRNAVVFHRAMLAGNYNTVVAAANCHETYYGHDIGWWRIECLRRARTRRQLLTGDASPTPGLRYAARHPARAVLVAGVRVLRTFSFFQPLRIGRSEPRRQWLDVLGLVMYYPLLVLATVGLSRRARPRWLLFAPIATALLVGATGWGNSRFRIGADVAIVVLAALELAGRTRGSGAGEAPARGRREVLVES
jgi:4-amino-4-deoxy-L-arabinose transferase-like glycosyltransferase